MTTLSEIFTRQLEAHTDKGSAHSYIEVYDDLLKDKKVGVMLEIGVFKGYSLAMWQEFFPLALVLGLDIDLTHVEMPNLKVIQGDATNYEFLRETFGHLRFDLVIDDGSHLLEDQIKSFEAFRLLMNQGSLYVIEDIQDPATYDRLLALDPAARLIDRRSVKNRYDDVLIVYSF